MKDVISNLLGPLSLSLLAIGASPVLAPQEAEGLLAAYRAGLGDAEALASLGVVRSRGTLSFEGFTGEGPYQELLAPGGAARIEATFVGAPPTHTCTNGELYWMSGTGGVEIKQGWSAAADARQFALGRHRDWREVYTSAELVGEATVGGRACHELRMVPKPPAALGIAEVPGEEPPVPDTWWLDQETGELVQVALYATISGGGWQRLVIGYSDWRSVGGVRFPFQSTVCFGPPEAPVTIRLACQGVELDAQVPESVFQPDEPVFRALTKLRTGETHAEPDFALQRLEETPAATVRLRCARADLQRQLAIVLPEVMSHLTRERIGLAGAPFARYHALGEEIELEAGIPVAQGFAGSGRVRASRLPGGDVVTGMHVGPYQELTRTHEALDRWLAARGLVKAGGPWEVYWTDPGLERDPAKWRTEILQPVTAASAAAARAAAEANTGTARRINGSGPPETPERDPELAALGELALGTWKVEGGADGPRGTLVFEWLAGGHFLLQHVDLVHGEHVVQGIEIIGRERPMGESTASAELKSRFYDNQGNTLDYVWELDGRDLTIWVGQPGSPASFEGRFSEDGTRLVGGWKWPGGGFDLVGTRVVGKE